MTDTTLDLERDLHVLPFYHQMAAKLCLQVLKQWKLSITEQMALTGLTLKQFLLWQQNAVTPPEASTYLRLSTLLHINKTLKLRGMNRQQIVVWLKTPKKALTGNSPVNHMIGLGYEGLTNVNELAVLEGEQCTANTSIN